MAHGFMEGLDMGYKRQQFAYAGIIMLLWVSQWCTTTADYRHELKLCSLVLEEFLPCVMYLSGRARESQPPVACCAAINRLNHQVKIHKYGPERFCQCIEDFTDVMKIGMAPTRIENLHKNCPIHLNFPISVSFNCSRALDD